MTMNYEILQNFVKDVIEVKGGIAEEKEKGVLDILLPETLPVSYTHLTLPTICSV